MTPEMILLTLRAGFEFGTEALKFAQTEQGKKLIDQSLADRAKWDAFWKDVSKGLKTVFSGEFVK